MIQSTAKEYTYGNISKQKLSHFDEKLQITQFHYGVPGVISKIKTLEAFNLDELNQYLSKKPIPYVLGPDGRKWIIDRHHFSLSLVQLRKQFLRNGLDLNSILVNYQRVHLKGVKNSSLLTMDEFEEELFRRKLLYPFKDGIRQPIAKLPKHITGLVPSYYRGLAWLVRKSNAYNKTDIPFAEFYWADYMKEALNFKKEKFSDGKIKKAIKLALTDNSETRELPGFNAHNLSKEDFKLRLEEAMETLRENELID
jgi:hypothetical protein